MPKNMVTAANTRRLPVQRSRSLLYATTTAALLMSAAMGTKSPAAVPTGTPPPPTTAQQERGMAVGRPFSDPADADAGSASGSRLTITLDAAQTRFDVSGKTTYGESYNGAFVAPTIHVRPGRTVTVHLVNHLTVATNLHFHGLHVSPAGQSDNPFLCVAPGDSTTYELAIPSHHPLGTFWYHSHAMGTTCPDSGSASHTNHAGHAGMAGMASMNDGGMMIGDVENQIFAGLSGALVVGDDRALLPPELRRITTHTFALKDVQLDAGSHILQNTHTTEIDSGNPTVRLVNGRLRPVLTMRPNETQLWRLANIGADIFYQLRLDGHHFTVINEDGTPVARTRNDDTLLLPPGKRYDVLVTAPSKPGSAVLRTTAYSNGPQGDAYPDTSLATVEAAGRQVPRLPGVSGPMPTAPADLSAAPVAQHRTVKLTENEDGTKFSINGKPFSMNSSVFDTPARLGTVEEWTVLNASGEIHPFHLHTNAFQVTSINGVAQPYTHDQDIVPVPHAKNGVPGKVVIRVAFKDFPGKWMFHCHIAAHEDNGMMSYINVVR